MWKKQTVVGLMLLVQACGQLSAQTPEESGSPGILERLRLRAREAKAKVQTVGGVVAGFTYAYYEDHIKPVTDPYRDWVSSVRRSVGDRLYASVKNYTSS